MGGSIPPRAAKINNMTDLRDEIAYLEYGKKYKDLTPGQKKEVDYENDWAQPDILYPDGSTN